MLGLWLIPSCPCRLLPAVSPSRVLICDPGSIPILQRHRPGRGAMGLHGKLSNKTNSVVESAHWPLFPWAKSRLHV